MICHLPNSHLLSSLLCSYIQFSEGCSTFKVFVESLPYIAVVGNKASSVFCSLNFPLWLLGAVTGPAQPFLWSEPGSSYVCIAVVSDSFHSQVPTLHGVPHHRLTAVWGTVKPISRAWAKQKRVPFTVVTVLFLSFSLWLEAINTDRKVLFDFFSKDYLNCNFIICEKWEYEGIYNSYEVKRVNFYN